MLVSNEPSIVKRDWGYFLQFTRNENTTVKVIRIKAGRSTHLQTHKHRTEQWFVISGRVWIVKGELSTMMMPGDSTTIEIGEKHRFEGVDDSVILEISRGLFDETDITHYDK